ncbi:hypothetical protein BJI67_07925 [Acidihalobacter aeolianus]|uniref:Uncharacterized protein n=1 Tax=Acidihalobacter aeolianus TaxID=2792603 RepID=A0A1D8K7Q3_9GAMM|nr:hypothetical protein BJI67_07925 [Acidihalobacter aeolianus]
MEAQKHSADWLEIMQEVLGSPPARQKPSTGIVVQPIRATQSQKSIWLLHMPMVLMCTPTRTGLFIGLEKLHYNPISWLKTISVLLMNSAEAFIAITIKRYIGFLWPHRRVMHVPNTIWEACIFED